MTKLGSMVLGHRIQGGPLPFRSRAIITPANNGFPTRVNKILTYRLGVITCYKIKTGRCLYPPKQCIILKEVNPSNLAHLYCLIPHLSNSINPCSKSIEKT